MPRESGIYLIRCLPTGKVYVGSSKNIYKRAKEHLSDLRRGIHHSFRLQRAWSRYGESAFAIEVLEICHPDELIEREQRQLDLAKAAVPRHGFNVLPLAGSAAGGTHTPEARAKISAAITGRKLSDTHKARIGDLHRGRKRSPETRERIRQANLGKKLTEEHRAKIRSGVVARNASGWVMPPEAIARGAAARRGKPRSEEAKAKQSAAMKGRTLTAEHRKKLSEARAGKKRGPQTPEARAKISAAALRRFQDPEERRRLSDRQKGKTLSPEHIAALRAGHAAHFARRKAGGDADAGLHHSPDENR